ncbi:MAG TPA: response regulator [Bryobacteraceae bacterium]|nr:response regulator [Bryobacteraceae bacterium]
MSESPRVLLVDDDRQVVRYLQKALEADDYAVVATTSGKQALANMRTAVPDLLIMDLNMPAPDGFELLRTVRGEFPYLRVLAISGYLDGALLEAAAVLGAIATLSKPIAADTLLAKVREVIGPS